LAARRNRSSKLACFGQRNSVQMRQACDENPTCTGFTFEQNAVVSGGCLKACGDGKFGGFGEGSYDYFVGLDEEKERIELRREKGRRYSVKYSGRWPNCNNIACFGQRTHEWASGLHSLTIALKRRGAPRVVSYSYSAGGTGTASLATGPEDFATMGSHAVCEAVCGCWPCLDSRSCVETLEPVLQPLFRQEALLATLRRPLRAQAAYEKILGQNPPETALCPPFEDLQSLANRSEPATLRHTPHVERLCAPRCDLFPKNLALLRTHLWARFETSIPADGTLLDIDSIQLTVHWAVTSNLRSFKVGEHWIDFPNHPGNHMQNWCRVTHPLVPQCASVLWSHVVGKGEDDTIGLQIAELSSTLASYMADLRRRTLLVATAHFKGFKRMFTWMERRMHGEGDWTDFESTWRTSLLAAASDREPWEAGNYTLTRRYYFSTL
jgi:hypothetical protein